MARMPMTAPIMTTTYSRTGRSGSQGSRHPAGFGVDPEYLLDRVPGKPVDGLDRGTDDVDDRQEREATLQERFHRHFVGSIHSGRSGSTHSTYVIGEVQGREGNTIRIPELEVQVGQLQRRIRSWHAPWIGEGVLDRDPHVGLAELSFDRTVDEFHQGVDDRTGMHDHLDPVEIDPEEVMGLDDL